MKIGFIDFEKKFIDGIYKIEKVRKNREKELTERKCTEKNILPKYVMNRHIKIITNGEIVFDSNDFNKGEIPISIQYTIKKFGYPDTIKYNNKTPLIYNITSKAAPLFPNEEEQNLCMKRLK